MPERQTAVVVPGVSPDVFPWDKHPLPPVLYKYLRPQRHVDLTQCLIRFSQRQVFTDELELKPNVETFGTESEIMAFFESDPVLVRYPPGLRWLVTQHVLNTPGRQASLIELAQSQIKSADEFAVLCLSEDPACERMWQEYADGRRGFMVAFNTTSPAFDLLQTPGRIGKVEYSDEPITSFLSAYGPNAFFRKRTRYRFEAEWRSLRALHRFSEVRRPEGALPIYLSRFDPACICKILIRPQCTVEWELRTLAAIDCRYRHVPVVAVP